MFAGCVGSGVVLTGGGTSGVEVGDGEEGSGVVDVVGGMDCGSAVGEVVALLSVIVDVVSSVVEGLDGPAGAPTL